MLSIGPGATLRYLFVFSIFQKSSKYWSWREELNLQPVVYKTTALPLSYASQMLRKERLIIGPQRERSNCSETCQAIAPPVRQVGEGAS